MADTPNTEPKKSRISRDALDAGATGIAAGIGVAVAHNSIQDSAYQQYKSTWEELVKLRNKRRIDEDGILTKTFEGPPRNQYAALKKDFKDEVKKIFETRGLKNDYDYWTVINPTRRIKVAAEVGTTAGIALGVLLTVANLKSISKALSHDDNGKSSPGR